MQSGRRPSVAHYAILAFTTVLVLYPFATMLSLSLHTNSDLLSDPSLIPQRPTLENYSEMWGIAPFGDFFRNSLVVSMSATVATVALGAPAAYALSRYVFPGSGTIRSLLFYTQLLPVAGLLLPLFVLARIGGVYNTIFGLAGTYTGLFLPVVVIMLQGFYAQIPREFGEAAHVDGASNLQTFRYVALPLSIAGMTAVASIVFIACWEEYILALTLTSGSGPRTVPIGLTYFFSSFQTNYAGLMAASVVSTLPVILVLAVSGRFVVRGIAQGGLKG